MSANAESSDAARATYQRAMAIVRAASLVVPACRRREWLGEWDGELSYRISTLDRGGRLDARMTAAILVRTLGAFSHALWVLRDEARVETMLQDIRYALRSSLRRPAFSLLVVLTLGVGVGANSAMFSIIDSVLIQPLPYERSEQLVYIFGAFKGGNQASISPPDFLDYRARQTLFSSLAARTVFGSAVISGGDRPERVPASIATANFFSTLGIQPSLGRAFLPDEEHGAHDVAIISRRLWQQRFGENPAIVGTSVTIDGRPHIIVGVLPSIADEAIGAVQVWRPVAFGTGEANVRRFHFLRGLGRLAPGVTIEGAQREMDGIARQLEQAYPENETWKLRLVPYRDVVVGPAVAQSLVMLMGAVGLVLLIACGNVANLLLARATARGGEMAIRTALGASRPRLVRQLLTESLVLGLGAGTVGLALAYYLVRGVRAVAAGIVPRLSELALDQTTLLFTFALALATSLVFGLAPALQAAKGGVAAALTSFGRGSGGRGGARARDVLVVAQVAVSFVMLIVAGLLIRSLWQLQRVNPEFDPRGVFTAEITLPPTRYGEHAAAERFWTALLDRVRSISGVETAAGTTLLPLRGGGDTYFYVDGRPPATDADRLNATVSIVTDDYFTAMRIPVKSGRTFTEADRTGPGVMLINDALARRLFPGGNAVGQRLVVDFGKPFRGEIVGVVSDVRIYGQVNEVPDQMYFSSRQPAAGFGAPRMRLVARVQGDPSAITPQVRAILRELDPDVPLASVESMDEILAGSVRNVRLRAGLLAGFAGIGLLLAVIGLYGVLAYSVARRSRELGIRIALGARSSEVFRLVVGEGMRLVALGVALGLGGSFAATRFLSSMLFEVGRTDPNVFAAVTLALLSSGLVACMLPARRATRVDAMEALRSE